MTGIPIPMLTRLEVDEARGLDAGADDHVANLHAAKLLTAEAG